MTAARIEPNFLPRPTSHSYIRRSCRLRPGFDSPTGAVLIDFCSLHQKGDGGQQRTPNEQALYDKALAGLAAWYAHPATVVLKATALPPHASGQPAYLERGWCFCESTLADLVKDPMSHLDLGKLSGETAGIDAIIGECGGGRAPPLAPEDMRTRLASKAFHDATDAAAAAKVYEAGFERIVASTDLQLSELGWGDDEAISFAKVIESGAMTKLENLNLGDNKIGDAGLAALAAAARDGSTLPELRELWMNGNQVNDEGTHALTAAIANGGFPSLTYFDLDFNPASDDAVYAAEDALEEAREKKQAA